MSGKKARQKYWWGQEPEKAAGTLITLATQFDQRNNFRKAEAWRLMQLYEGERVGGQSSYFSDSVASNSVGAVAGAEPVDITLNIAQDLVDTLVSKIASLENPKSQFVTTDSSWEVRRQAILCDRFVEGQFGQKQGKFQDLWEMFAHALRLSLSSTGTTAIKFFADDVSGKIRAELYDCLDVWQDCTAHDAPTSMGASHWWDPEHLCELYPEHEEKIFSAMEPYRPYNLLENSNDEYDRVIERTERVRVVESWRFKYGDTVGKYCRAIKGQLLEWEDYEYEDSPFVFIGGVRNLTGCWNRTLTKPIAYQILRVNEILASIDRAERLTPKGTLMFDPEEIPKEALESVGDFDLIPITGLSGMRGKPQYEAPPPFHPLALELVKYYRQACYDLSGISQMHTAGTREQGITSGVALRIVKQLINERFAPVQRAYVNAAAVQATHMIIRCARKLAESDKGFSSAWKGDGFIQEIDAKVLSVLEDNLYEVTVDAVAESKNSPEDRMQLATELVQGGIITGESWKAILTSYYTYGELRTSDSQRRYVQKQIDSWLFSDPDEISDTRFYRGPIRSMQMAAAATQVNGAYLDALTDEVDESRLVFFSRFLKQCKAFIEEDQQKLAGLAQQSGGTAAALNTITGAAA